jgi:drug/metabolite transporter (DMT)-like permease
VAPLLVTAVSVLVLGASFSGVQLLAIGLIAAGIMSISLVRNGEGSFQWQGAVLALITGAFIAGYSMVAGMGARAAGTAVGYFGLQAAVNAVIFTVLSLIVRPASVRSAMRLKTHILLGGGASFAAYALVVYAFLFAPIAMVTALRETSIIFALVIGSVVFHERVHIRKVAAAMSTICGVIVLRVYRG